MNKPIFKANRKKPLTKELLDSIVPKQYKKQVDDDLVDHLNLISEDPDYGEEFKQNILTSTSILGGKNSKWSLAMYVDAVKYFSLTAAQMSQVDAYTAIFPERLQVRLDRGETKEDMRGEASRYNNSELVNRIREQALVPLHLTNQGNVQVGINVLVDIATHGRSEVARVSAATALLKELRPAETTKIELDIGVSNVDSIADLRKATEELAIAQRQSIEAGNAVKSIAESKIVDAEVIEDE